MNLTLPRYSCSLVLPQLHFTYLQKQFHDTVKLMEFFANFNKFLLNKRENLKYLQVRPLDFEPGVRRSRSLDLEEHTPATLSRLRWVFAIECVRKVIRQRKDRSVNLFVMPEGIRNYYEEQFKMLHRKLKKAIEFSSEEQQCYDRTIYIVPLHDLYDWTRQVLRVIKNEEERKTQQTQKKGLFSWFSGKAAAPEEVKEDYESLFKEIGQEIDTSELEAPNDYVWLVVDFELTSGMLALRKIKANGLGLEGLNFCIGNVKCSVTAAAEAYNLAFCIEDCRFECLTEEFPEPFLEKAAETENILQVQYRYKPAGSLYHSHLAFSSRSFTFIYTPKSISMLVSFFVVPNAQESFKAAAWDRWQEIQDSTQGTLTDLLHSEVKVLIELDIEAPVLVLPIDQGSFALSLGNLKMSNEESQDSLHERFSTSLTSVAFFYNSLKQGRIDVIPEFSIQMTAGFLKKKISKKKAKLRVTQYDTVPDITISCTLPELRCHLAPSVYSRLLNIREYIQLDNEVWTGVSREEVLSCAVLAANVQRQGTSVKSWQENEAIISKSYVYFFLPDNTPTSYFWLKDCSVRDASSELQVANALKISNRYGECVLAFETRPEAQMWIRTIGEMVTELATGTSAAIDNDHLKNLIKGTKMVLKADIVLHQFVMRLSNEQREEWFEYRSTDITSEITARPYDQQVKASMHTITIIDLLKPADHPFRLIADTDSGTSLIDIDYKSASQRSPVYEGEDVVLYVKLRQLELNWNPDLVTSLLNFLDFAKSKHSQNAPIQTVGRLQPKHILLKLDVTVDSIALHFNVLENRVRLATVLLEGLTTQFLVKNSGYYWVGDLHNMTVSDMTQYPELALLRPLSSITPFVLISVQ